MIKISFCPDVGPNPVSFMDVCSYCERLSPERNSEMKEHILCAVDFTESSLNVLRWANRIAAGMGADLSVLYSYRLIQTGKVADILSFKRKTEEEARRNYLELTAALKDTALVRASFITEIGFFSDNIEKFVRKNPSAVVVLGEQLARELYDHKAPPLLSFLNTVQVPLFIVPSSSPGTGGTPTSPEQQSAERTIPV